MEAFVSHGCNKLSIQRLNHYRLYLQVISLSDIVDASGRRILQHCLDGRSFQDQVSTHKWSTQPRPYRRDWKLWSKTISTLFLNQKSTRLVTQLGTWTSRSHQRWRWFYDVVHGILYCKRGLLYIRYVPDDDMILNTRTNGVWYKRASVALPVDKAYLCMCTVERNTSQHVLFTSFSADYQDPLLPTYHSNDDNLHPPTQYTIMRSFSDNDLGRLLANKLLTHDGRLVGEGSYERQNDRGGAAVILESNDQVSCVTNALPVPGNSYNTTKHSTDPYRCELFSIFKGLLLVYDLEQIYHCTFAPIIVVLDNDAAIDMSIEYDSEILVSDQHFDILRCIRSLRSKIQTPLPAKHVEGHHDRHIPFMQLSRLEQLNKMCDDMANYACTTLWNYPEIQSPLQLPYEDTSIWADQRKIYRNFMSTLTDHCAELAMKSYYKQKYSWTDVDFESINWDAVHATMHMYSPSTRTWIGKFASGFIGTAQMRFRREKWIDAHCPCCNTITETNIHVIKCSNPATRERMTLQLTDLYTWMKGIGVGSDFVSDFEKRTIAWLDDADIENRNSLSLPSRAQLALGWTHLMFGRIHLEFINHITVLYQTRGVRREAQRFITLLIHRLWTRIIRPMWTARNQIVHALDSHTAESRIHIDLKAEVSELYNSTNVDMLPHPARTLFDDDLHVILESPVHSLQAWCNSVEIEIARQSTTYDDPGDLSQTVFSIAPPESNPQQRPRLPTAITHPTLTPVQIGIQRRRVRLVRSQPLHQPPTTTIAPPHQPPPNPHNPIPPVQPNPRPRHHRRRRLTLTRRVAPPSHPRTTQPEPSIEPHSQLDPILENSRTRMLRGS